MSNRHLQLNKISIESRESDHFINATQLCKAGGKKFNDWYKTGPTKELIKELEKTLLNEQELQNNTEFLTSLQVASAISNEIQNEASSSEVTPNPTSLKLVDIKNGGKYRGSWIHPDLAVQLAQWISPVFSIQVSRWVRELITTGSVSVDSRKTDQELIELTKQLQLRDQELEVQAQKLQISEGKNLQLTTKIKDTEALKINGFVYISTTRQYSQNNQYKIGKTVRLNGRMSTYQTGRAQNDEMYYLFVFESEEYDFLETIIRRLLIKFRDVKQRDMYVLPYNLLHKYMAHVCNLFRTGFINELNNLIIDNLEFDVDVQSQDIPEPYDFANKGFKWFNEYSDDSDNEQSDDSSIDELSQTLGRLELTPSDSVSTLVISLPSVSSNTIKTKLRTKEQTHTVFTKWFKQSYVYSRQRTDVISMKSIFDQFRTQPTYTLLRSTEQKFITKTTLCDLICCDAIMKKNLYKILYINGKTHCSIFTHLRALI